MKKIRVDFNEILEELRVAKLEPNVLRRPDSPLALTSITADSRKAAPGGLFCAIKGANHDGHKAVAALESIIGLAIVEDSNPAYDECHCGIIKVSSSRAAWAQLASFFEGHPAGQLSMVGITGTNGKTSTTWMLKDIMTSMGIKVATFGTLGFYMGDQHRESQHTTPDPDVLYPLLSEAVSNGITHVVMEVSSHSLVQGKLWPIRFDAAAFTSFSQDHLDFHKDMNDYLNAKLSLFSHYMRNNALGLVHTSVLSHALAREKLQALNSSRELALFSYASGDNDATYEVRSVSIPELGLSRLNVRSAEPADDGLFVIPMIGDVFCENFAAAVVLTSVLLNKTIQDLATRTSTHPVSPVPGRLELVRKASKPWRPLVYVDYAHTPDALEKAITNLKFPKHHLSVIFGCGGDRDRLKRPLMGQIASTLADQVIVTSDNPRTENPTKIITDIMAGISEPNKAQAIENRRIAIEKGIQTLGARRTVLIAGKGHENYQIIGDTKNFFCDQDEALRALSRPKTWLVFGAGVSGFSASRLLADSGDVVYLTDDNTITVPLDFPETISIVANHEIPWKDIDQAVVSPGISPDNNVVKLIKQHGIECLTEIDLGFDRYQGSIVAVTGTNGKSTTVAMTEAILRAIGNDAVACGNIGLPPTALGLAKKDSHHTAVVELSSYQLEGCYPWPAVGAAITSFSFDHLARHKTIENYFKTKWSITDWLSKDSIFVVSADVARFAEAQSSQWPDCHTVIISPSPLAPDWLPHTKKIILQNGVCQFGKDKLDLRTYQLIGMHNQMNGLTAALLAGHRLGRPLRDLLPTLTNYRALPFRCEVIFNRGGRIIVNDSKSTNLESTVAALSLATRPAVLLMGGQGKGESYKDLCRAREKIQMLITFGASGQTIASDAPPDLQTEVFAKMNAAVLRALEIARDNNYDVIFSPGCASFDEFRNFEHRGTVFNQLVADFLK